MRDWRLVTFQCFLFGTIFLLAIALFNIQVLNGSHYRSLGEKNRIRLIRMEAPRGAILDRNGTPLAKTRPSFDIFIVPEDFDSRNVEALAKILELDPRKIRKKLKKLSDAPFVPVLMKKDVSKETLFRIEERKPAFAGVLTQVSGLRYYPQGTGSSHVLGYLGKITKEEMERDEEGRFRPDDWVGRSGVEKTFDLALKGEDGGMQVEVNNRGRQIRVLGEKEPVAGENLDLTIDAKLQQIAADALGEKNGAVCLLDIETGELLTLMSKPEFDPNVFVSPAESDERLKLMRDNKQMPLLNRGISAGFPPGSVFKLVTAIAALETRRITPETTFQCNGSFRLSPSSRPFKCWNSDGHGPVNLYEAIERSCNVYFYQAGLKIGARNLSTYARELGLGEVIRIELSNVAGGFVPDEEWKKKQFRDLWYDGETLNFSIGQGYVLTTPLQLARLVGAIASEGEMPELHVVKGAASRKKKIPVRTENMRLLKKAMRRVVQADRGTGQLARVEFIEMAAKTGTAQVPPKEPHSWFSGFFPFDHPKYAMVVFVEHGGSGGYYAAPIAKKVIMGMKELNYFKEGAAGEPLVA